MRKVIFISVVSVALLMSGCGNKEKKDESVKQKIPSAIKVTRDAIKKDAKEEVSKANSGQFYYSYNKEGESKEAKGIIKYNSQSNKVKTTIDAYLNIKSPYERVRITMILKRLGKDYIVKCSACHDDYANGVIGPSLLDKDQDFIYQRIIDFKTGKKDNILMKELVMQISDKKLKDIAGEIANFNKQIRKMRNKK